MIDTAQSLWLVVLFVAWGLLLFGGFLIGKPDPEKIHRTPTWMRLGSSLALVIAAWSWFVFTLGNTNGSFMFWIALGMTSGFVGDLFMARVLRIFKEHLLGGMGSFGLGHIAYIIALLTVGDQTGLNASGPRWTAWIIWLLIGIVGWFLVIWRGRSRSSFLRWAALPYALLLSSVAGFAFGLALQSATFLPIAIGTALFFVSDLILSAQVFSDLYFPLIGDVIWLAYGPAQMLIVFGAGIASSMFAR